MMKKASASAIRKKTYRPKKQKIDFKELWAIQTLNKVDNVFELDINDYYKCIIIKELIKNWRNK